MSERDEDKGLTGKKGEEFLQIFKKGAEFTQDLLKENERLRFQLLELEQAARQQQAGSGAGDPELDRLRRRVEDLEQEKQEILHRIKHVEEENLDFANRYVEIENENNMLANLYIASYQLHSTLDFREVLQVITEIVINLIGAEEFAIMLLDEKTNRLTAMATEGLDPETLPTIELGQGIIGQMAKTGENYFIEEMENYQRDFSHPLVCIPLKIKEHVIGVIVIYKLLEQKSRFAEVDYELFTLLAGHAATAIFSSKLYSESERKLSTIQGFLDLMTK
ncbi:GAF domain-containing protein [Desulfuromonas carbonis]|uniref:GAF domain-containing protein n=1 Tax=Desulfuromonas sp. DDH964 TaxID=1823759 RepID=UPI00078B2AFD|nr:GAF domain-containing protein [Desulfuromonas sp. DDH964]AMV72009.1 GAF domain-containing protein [Desulfuromonas sp. DDH964]